MPPPAPTSLTHPRARLPPALSLYLDAWRFLAALAVMMCHFGSHRMSGGLLWQLTPYGAQAVDVFFVLSGYIITFTAAARETTPRAFALSRLARLWSVAVPALVLTFSLDAAGRWINPAAYAGMPGHPIKGAIIWQALAGLFFVNQLWHHAVPVGANIPWWSLGYEAPYYVAFACLVFGGRFVRVAGPVLAAAVTGPAVTIMSSLWFAGAAIQRRHARARAPAAVPWAGLLVVPALWSAYEAASWLFGRPMGASALSRPELPQDLLIGGLFAVHLWQAPALLARLPACPALMARIIRFGASRSFALYLFHYPVMLFLRAIMLRAVPGWSPLLLIPATLAICAGLAEVTEARKGAWRRQLDRLLPSDRGGFLRTGAQG